MLFTEGVGGCKPSITKSAPSNSFACLLMSFCKFSLKELMATSAAMPKIMLETKSKRRARLRRLSRQARFKIKLFNFN